MIIDFESWRSQEASAQNLLSTRGYVATVLQGGLQFGKAEIRLDGIPLSSFDDEAYGS